MLESADVQLWVKPCRFLSEVGKAILGRAEEVVLDLRWTVMKAAVHKLRTVDAVGHGVLAGGQVYTPSERHTVGDEVIDGLRAAAEFRIGEAKNSDVGVREVDNSRLFWCATIEDLR